MIIDRIKKKEEEILKQMGDSEVCHILEDEILKAIIFNLHQMDSEELLEAQKIAKRVHKLKFNRWYA